MDIEQAVYEFWSDETTSTEMLTYVLGVAKGQSISEWTCDWDDGFGLDDAQLLCNRLKLFYTGVLKQDIERAHNRQPPIYFMEHAKWVALYRRRHGVTYIPPVSRGLVHIGSHDMVESAMSRIESGYDAMPADLGWACPREQSYFYGTDEWKNCAKAYRYIGGYHCSRCGHSDKPLHVHHNTPIVSAYHRNFNLDFAWWRLESACEECHTDIHLHTIRGIGHYGYDYTSPRYIKKEKGLLRKAWAKHHKDGVCGWCNEHPETDKEEIYFY